MKPEEIKHDNRVAELESKLEEAYVDITRLRSVIVTYHLGEHESKLTELQSTIDQQKAEIADLNENLHLNQVRNGSEQQQLIEMIGKTPLKAIHELQSQLTEANQRGEKLASEIGQYFLMCEIDGIADYAYDVEQRNSIVRKALSEYESTKVKYRAEGSSDE